MNVMQVYYVKKRFVFRDNFSVCVSHDQMVIDN